MSRRNILICALVFSVPAYVYGIILDVPGEYSNINQAILSATESDTVLVHPGIYPERIIFPAINFSLFSEYALTGDTNAILNTVIDAGAFAGDDTASVLVFTNGNDSSMIVRGFTIRGGHGVIGSEQLRYGGGVFIAASHPTLVSNHVTANEANWYAAAQLSESYSRFTGNAFFNNCVSVRGLIGVLNNNPLGPSMVFEWNDVYGNYGCANGDSVDADDPGILAFESHLVLRFNRFHDYSGREALSVEYYYTSSGEVHGNVFEHITATYFGIIVVAHRSDVVITDNVFRDCLTNDGQCIGLDRTSLFGTSHVERNWFENIVNNGVGPACIYAQHPNVHIAENTFLNCTGGSAAGIQFSQSAGEGCLGEIERNQFFGNRLWTPNEPAVGSAISSSGGGSLCAVHNNWFEDNQAPAIAYEFSDHQPWDLSQNFWGDSSGPYHPALNPDGQGDTLYGDFEIIPWLTEPPLDVTVRHSSGSIPANWSLQTAFPNPFNSSVRLRLVSDRSQSFEVKAYNIQGQLVRTVWRGLVPKDGAVDVMWDGQDAQYHPCASGLYLITACPLTGSNRTLQTVKAMMLR